MQSNFNGDPSTAIRGAVLKTNLRNAEKKGERSWRERGWAVLGYVLQHVLNSDIWTANCLTFRVQASNNTDINDSLLKCCQAQFREVLYVHVMHCIAGMEADSAGLHRLNVRWEQLGGLCVADFIASCLCLLYCFLCLLYIVWVSFRETHQEPVSCLVYLPVCLHWHSSLNILCLV